MAYGQVQCPNCRGCDVEWWTVHDESAYSRLNRDPLLRLCGLLIAIPALLLLVQSRSRLPAFAIMVVGAIGLGLYVLNALRARKVDHYEGRCRLCKYRWTWTVGDPSQHGRPDAAQRELIRKGGARRKAEEEERRRRRWD